MIKFFLSLFLTVTCGQLLAQNCTFTVTAAAGSNTICAGGSVNITAQTSGGNGPFTYQWNNGQTTQTITVTSAGTYTVTVTDNTPGCGGVTASATISKPTFLKVEDQYICSGNSATITASGADSYVWTDASGNTVSTQASYTTPPLSSTTTYYVNGTKSGCSTGPTPVTINVVPLPAAPNAPGASICSGSSVTLSASSPTGTVFDWFATPTGGTSLITSPDYTTPALTATTTYYVQTYNTGCPGPRTAVTVTVNPLPSDPQTANQSICANPSATLTATASGGTIKWFDSSFGKTPLATGGSFTTPNLSSSTTYYVENDNDQTGCTSKRIAVVVTVMQPVPHPTAPGTIICSGTAATLTASSTQTGTTFQWYDAATGGNLIFTGASFTTPVLNAATSYFVQGTYQGCTGERTEVDVAVTTMPAQPVLTGTSTICSGSSASITASGGAPTYRWYDAATGSNLLFTGETYITPTLTTNTTYYAEASNGNCATARVAFNITVTPATPAPSVSAPSAPICPGGTATLSASGQGTITWYDAASGGNAVATGTSFTTPALSATTTYYAESNNGNCPSPRTAGTVNVTFVPDTVFSYGFGTFCVGSPPRSPFIDSRVSGPYHFTADNPGLLLNPTTGRITVTGSVPGTYVVTLTTSSNPCIMAMQTITISAGAGSANFSYSPNTFCQYDPNPSPTFGTNAYAGRFSATPAGLVFVDNTTGQIDLSQSKPGPYTITNRLFCSGATATATVTILQRTAVNAGPDQSVVTNTPYTISQSTKTGSAGVHWSTNGTGSFSSSNTQLQPTYVPGPNEINPVTLTLTADNEGNGCTPLSDQMLITYTQPVITVQGATTCPGNPVTLTASGAPNGLYEWFTTATGGTAFFTGNPYVAAPTVTTTYYVGTINNGTPSARTPVTVTVNPTPTITVTGNTICFDHQAVLTATTNAPGGTFQWFDANGTLLSTGATYTTTYLQQNTRFFVQYNAIPCATAQVPVDVTVNPLPVISSPLTADACSGTALNYTIQSNVPDANVTYTWSRAAVNGITNTAVTGQGAAINETLINSTTSPVNVNYNISASSNGCSSTPFVLVVTVNPSLVFTSAATTEICDETSSDYNVQLNFVPASISWSRNAVPGIRNPSISDQTSPVIHEILYNDTNKPVVATYVYTARSSGCATSTFNVTVTVDPKASVTSAASGKICSGTAQNYTLTSDVSPATFNWSREAVAGISNGAATASQVTSITETLVNTTANPIRVNYAVTPFYGNCAGNVFTYSVTVNPTPAAPVITALDQVCTGTTLDLATTAVAGAVYAWAGPSNFTSAVQNPSISNITAANAGDYTLTVTVNGCTSPVFTKTIGVVVQPVVNAGPGQTRCAGYPIPLAGSVTGGTTSGVWSTNGTGTFSPSNTALNAVYMPSTADASLTSLTFTLSSATLANCSIATSTMVATLVPPPTANAGADQNICNQNSSVTLYGNVTNATTILWSTTGSGTFTTAANQATVTYVMSADDLKNGKVSFTLTASNPHCETSDQKTVYFLPPPVISAGKKLNYILRNTIFTLSPTVNESNVRYLWSPATYIDNDTLKNAMFKGVTDQTLTLKVTDTLGCVTTDQISFIILDPIITYNTFTPNGDGINDLWQIPSIIKYPGAVVDIYNRYGVQMFHSNGYGVPWDGTNNGQPVPAGVYYYVITTKFSSQVFSGYVTVLR